MDDFWSNLVQSPRELYTSRAVRFREDNAQEWLSAMGVQEGMRVLEMGCGPGLFCLRIASLLPTCQVVGLDRDTGLLRYAREKAQEQGLSDRVRFVEGDALQTAFADESFDCVFSYTVFEHLPPEPFLAEQMRLLRPGGHVCVMSVRPKLSQGVVTTPEPEELSLWQRIERVFPELPEGAQVGAYACSEGGMAAAVERAGFVQIATQLLTTLYYAPDSADVSPQLAQEMLMAQRISQEEPIHRALRLCGLQALTTEEWDRLWQMVIRRHDQRRLQYEQGEKQWDMGISTAFVVRGQRP